MGQTHSCQTPCPPPLRAASPYLPPASSAHQTDRPNLWRNFPKASPAAPGFHTGQDQKRKHQAPNATSTLQRVSEDLPFTVSHRLLAPTAAEGRRHGRACGLTPTSGRSGADSSTATTVAHDWCEGTGRVREATSGGATPGSSLPTPVLYSVTELECCQL